MSVWSDPPRPEAAASAYEMFVGRYGAQLAAELIAAAAIPEGGRALDVGCGPGALTAALADRPGAGQVAAIDPSQAFVNACRERVPAADARVGRVESLPFESDSFDAVLAQLVLQLVDDRELGIREMCRVARPEAVLAGSVWDWDQMPLLRAFWDAALALAPDQAGAFDDARRVGYKHRLELGQAFEAAGLDQVGNGEIWVSASYSSFDELWSPLEVGVGNSGALYAALSEADQRRLRADAFERLGRPAAGFALEARSWWARGIVPSRV